MRISSCKFCFEVEISKENFSNISSFFHTYLIASNSLLSPLVFFIWISSTRNNRLHGRFSSLTQSTSPGSYILRSHTQNFLWWVQSLHSGYSYKQIMIKYIRRKNYSIKNLVIYWLTFTIRTCKFGELLRKCSSNSRFKDNNDNSQIRNLKK